MSTHIKNIYKYIYKLLWLILSIFFRQTPTFIIVHGIHYEIIKNILPFLPSYKIYPATSWARDYLRRNHVAFSRFLFFPTYIVEANFHRNIMLLNKCDLSFQTLLEIKNLKQVQVYHGVVDKNFTYSNLNKYYDLLLVPGSYAKHRLLEIGIPEHKIKIVGFPKLDGYFKLIKKKKLRPSKEPVILYAPTWGVISSMPYMLETLIKLNKRYRLIVKPHYYTEWFYLDLFKRMNICCYDKNDDITELFTKADILISDSSSIMFEFLVTNKPIIVLDVKILLQGEMHTNSNKGPEIIFRHLFYRVKDISKLDSYILRILKKKPLLTPLRAQITRKIFEPIFPAGKKAAREIIEFIKR